MWQIIEESSKITAACFPTPTHELQGVFSSVHVSTGSRACLCCYCSAVTSLVRAGGGTEQLLRVEEDTVPYFCCAAAEGIP